MDNQPTQPTQPTKPKLNLAKLKSKKTLLIAGIAIIALTVITSITLLVLSNINPFETNTVVTIESATELKDNGIAALKEGNDAVAEDMFTQAKEQYQELGNTNGVIDMEAQLYLLEHAN